MKIYGSTIVSKHLPMTYHIQGIALDPEGKMKYKTTKFSSNHMAFFFLFFFFFLFSYGVLNTTQELTTPPKPHLCCCRSRGITETRRGRLPLHLGHLGHTWATPGPHLGHTWATPGPHLGHTCATCAGRGGPGPGGLGYSPCRERSSRGASGEPGGVIPRPRGARPPPARALGAPGAAAPPAAAGTVGRAAEPSNFIVSPQTEEYQDIRITQKEE
ncbi:unnamed protein product [Nyctereutes procyonoides]|uniref:(raccoon dog) hypothetical protein n=1 Tax=Nyctereutes procyonoides TaxID=34880 RepID=A0A811Y5G0_NYCPR|nr:unnamed protein product [Nyctereutes procyonoides]